MCYVHSLQKVEKIRERALRFLYNDHTSSYDALLVKFNHRPNQVTYGSNSLRTLAPIWNSLPNEIKSADNFAAFKRLIREWEGIKCGCNVCRHTES